MERRRQVDECFGALEFEALVERPLLRIRCSSDAATANRRRAFRDRSAILPFCRRAVEQAGGGGRRR
nr:hypothetical protein Iba_scaffold46870CG0010 [Ipomoea batatas]GME01310.1 hypothetical protein Iba_scaffold57221CG0010 [Ipomoea batatas]